MTQARPGNHYMLSRLKPNGQFIDRLLVKMAVTVHTMRIDTLMENYGFIQLYWTVTKQQVCTFKYRSGEMTYGNEMQDVMPNIFNDRYTSAIYNPVENLMILDVNINF